MTTPEEKPRGPIFVSGCPRSGTSALGWAMAACPHYWTSVETHFFYYLFTANGRNNLHQAFKASSEASSWLATHSVSYPEFLRAIGTGLDSLMRSRSDGVQWIDNSPENLLVADDLLLMFPHACIVHVVRDPRDVVASMLLSGFNKEAWSHHIEAGIATWRDYASAGLATKTKNPDRVIEVMHRQMIGYPKRVAKQLADRLDIPDAKPISDFLRSSKVNSSYNADSRIVDSAGGSQSASEADRRRFLQDHGDYILSRCQPYADTYGFEANRPN